MVTKALYLESLLEHEQMNSISDSMQTPARATRGGVMHTSRCKVYCVSC
jgi:hypothetical protein